MAPASPSSSSFCRCFLFFVFLFFVWLIAFTVSTFHPHSARSFYRKQSLVSSVCGTARPSDLLSYMHNLNGALDVLGNLMENSSFGIAQSGHGPDSAYVLAQCAGYLDHLGCFLCHRQSRHLLVSSCEPPVGGRFFLDGCFLRAENYWFFNETVSPVDASSCAGSAGSGIGFREYALGMMSDVVDRALQSGGYAFASGKASGGETMFAMAECWRTLDEAACRECLGGAAAVADWCIPSTESRVMNAGCVLRYSSSDFSSQYDFYTRASLFLFLAQILFLVVAPLLLVVISTGLGIYLGVLCYHKTIKWARKGKGKTKPQGIDPSVVAKNPTFKHSVLVKATDSFSKSNKLGQGGFGDVYRGRLPDGREIAVKRLFVRADSRGQEIYNEINIIGRAQHKNLVKFLGCSLSGEESLLVYEFLPRTSLDRILFDAEKKKELTWKNRLEVILGTAEGLEYLHNRCQCKIIHRDIKASNILLDEKMRPKIADFGLARLFSSDKSHVSTSIAGTLGYMAPEYIGHGQLSEKVDVYSFGVLVLEIVSGTRNSSFDKLDGNTLVTKAWKLYQSALSSQLIDENVEDSDPDEVSRLVRVGLLCTQEVPALRPCTSLLVEMLRHRDFHLPTPSKPPFVHDFSRTDTCEMSDTPLNPIVSYSSLDCSELYPR